MHAVAALAWVAVVVVVTGPRPCTSIIVVVVLATATNTSAQVGWGGARWGGVGWGASRGPSNPEAPKGRPLSFFLGPMAVLESRRSSPQKTAPAGAPALGWGTAWADLRVLSAVPCQNFPRFCPPAPMWVASQGVWARAQGPQPSHLVATNATVAILAQGTHSG